MAPDLNSFHTPHSDHEAYNAISSPSPPSPPTTPTGRRPNILYIMADQLAAPQLNMYNSSSQIRTPNLDQLARQAVVFDSAYTPSPLCAPSRMSMVSGQLPTQIGAYDNAASIPSDTITYAHYLRRAGYETTLAGKMHFIGDQLHGYERRLTPDIYPGDYGWVVNWDEPDTRLEWYHNASSILQAGPCVRSNQLDYDEEVMYRSSQYLYDHVRQGPDARPFCLTLSLTHPHDPYTIEQKYWDMYEDVEFEMPQVQIPDEEQDAHSKRLLKVCDLWDRKITPENIKRARRAYAGACSYVDACIGRIQKVLQETRLDENTIIIFSGDHGDMLGERNLWYKMSYFESSARVPLLVHYPSAFPARRVRDHVSTLDLLPTLVDLVGSQLSRDLPLDGHSLYPYLHGAQGAGKGTVFAEYCGEGTISPTCMIRRGAWKYVICPRDPDQLYNLVHDPQELHNLALPTRSQSASPALPHISAKEIKDVLSAFRAEALAKWDFASITRDVLKSQRQRRFAWGALKKGHFTSWDYKVEDDSRDRYIRSHLPLDDMELKARFPAVDEIGREIAPRTNNEIAPKRLNQAGAYGQ